LSWLTIIGIAVGLAMDAFAVAIVAGLTIEHLTRGHVFRLAFHFGLFQFLMPIAGYLAGRTVSGYIGGIDHWVAFGLLSCVGGKMLWESRREHGGRARADPTRGWRLVTLAVATSLDALAVGLSLAMLRVSVWMPSVVIGLVAAALTAVGIGFGKRLGARLGRWAEALGGAVLLAIGLKIVVSHLAM
jgi:putative Mn2+ efflux pump MntP